LRRRLEMAELLADGRVAGGERYFTSGIPERTSQLVSRLLGHSVVVEALPVQA
jgi:hypothetical protein